MQNISYSIFAQSDDNHVSAPPNSIDLSLSTSYYSLFAYDNNGQIAKRVNTRIVYIVNHYAIFVEDSSNNTSLPIYAQCIAQPIPFPTNIKILPEFVTATTFKIQWNPVAGIDLYRVYIRNIITNNISFFDTNKPEYIALDLIADTDYEIYVASQIGNNIFSAHVNPIQVKTLANVININVLATQVSMRLSWQAVAGATIYTIYRGVPGAGESKGVVEATIQNDFNYLITDLEIATQYTFSVIASKDTGETIASGVVTQKALSLLPSAPNSLDFVIENITPYGFDIRWSSTANADYYAIYLNYSEHPYASFIYDISTHISNLRPETMYAISVMAINNAGQAESQPVLIKTLTTLKTKPNTPRLIFPNPDYTTADPTPTLYWEVPDGQTGDHYDFIVEISEDFDFTKNVRKINSAFNKQGFSYQSPREANSKETVNFKVQDPLVIY